MDEVEEIRAEIRRVQKDISRVYTTLKLTFDEKLNQWPFEMIAGEEPSREFSFTINAAVIHRLLLGLGLYPESVLGPSLNMSSSEDEQLDIFLPIVVKAIGNLIKRSKDLHDSGKFGANIVTESHTLGNNNPITLFHLADVINMLGKIHDSKQDRHGTDQVVQLVESGSFRSFVNRFVIAAANKIKQAQSDPWEKLLELDPPYRAEAHAYPVVLTLYLYRTLQEFGKRFPQFQLDPEKLDQKINLTPFREFFKDRFHFHLSYSIIQEVHFDAAELAFALEGALFCNKIVPKTDEFEQIVIEKAFEELRRAQEISPNWQPIKPMISSSRHGWLWRPSSIQVAFSLLRVCNRLDEESGDGGHFSQNLPMFRKYSRWLFFRSIKGPTKDGREFFYGWPLEAVNAQDRIQLWETTLVLLFLKSYQTLLQRHLALIVLNTEKLRAEPVEQLGQSAVDFWKKACEPNEPMLSLSEDGEAKRSRYLIYAMIRQNYLEPRGFPPRGERNFSMILYGPPGTGKSSIAENLAKALGYRCIKITPSDFIIQGETNVEIRAQKIFDGLYEQENCLIFFDEIETLILDRNSRLYREQSDMFRFMTPNMLPKGTT